MRKKQRVLLIGGGSGGHIMPNLAIASYLVGADPVGRGGQLPLVAGGRSRWSRGADRGVKINPQETHALKAQILYIGSRLKMDRELVESAGLRFKAIFTGKLRRYFSWRNFVDPIFVLIGFFQSLWIIVRFWPHVVFAKGGFVCLPVALAAFILRRRVILHESDSVMGLSNRILACLATKVCVAFPDVMKNKKKIVFTGNPVRECIKDGDPEKGYSITGFHSQRPVVLIWGGSQGAQEINLITEESFQRIKSVFQIVHITGYGKKTCLSDSSYVQFEYLDKDLKHIYAITDVVVGRAGANSLYELAFMRKPNILIPLKSSAHNHQQMNAEYFQAQGASIILGDSSLADTLLALWHSPDQRGLMRDALSRVAKPDAAERIADIILSNSPTI